MNLSELSVATGITLDMLKAIIAERFQIIVLSNHAQLRGDVVQALLTGAAPAKSDKLSPAERPVNNANAVLLEQLEQTLAPQLAYTRKLLAYCIRKEFLFIIDICSLLHDQFYAFYALFKPVAQQSGARLIVPYVVTEEMKRMLIRRNKERDVLERCEKVMRFLLLERDAGLIEFVGSEDDKRTSRNGEKGVHADPLLLEKIMYFRNDARSVLLITQDHGFSVDALHLNNMQSSIANAVVLAKKITRRGALVDNADDAVCPSLPI